MGDRGQIVVAKIGSSSITGDDGTIDEAAIACAVVQISAPTGVVLGGGSGAMRSDADAAART